MTLCNYERFAAFVREAGLLPIDKGNGHWQIKLSAASKKTLNWWPESRRQTVFVQPNGMRLRRVDRLDEVIRLATKVLK